MAYYWDFPSDYPVGLWLCQTNFTYWPIISQYRNDYRRMMNFLYRIEYAFGILHLIIGVLGLVGGILAVITLFRGPFTATSFIYFKMISLLTPIYAAFVIYYGVSMMHLLSARTYYYVFMLSYVFGRGMINVILLWINGLAFMAAVERIVACLCPHWYGRLNKKSAALAIIFGMFPYCLAMYLPHVFAADIVHYPQHNAYIMVPRPWALGPYGRFYVKLIDYSYVVRTVLHAIAAVLVVIGLMKSVKQSKRVRQNEDKQATYWKQCRNMCYLQLCETVPLLCCNLLMLIFSLQQFVPDTVFRSPLDARVIPQLIPLIGRFYTMVWLDKMANLACIITYCLRFYFYLCFCPRIRVAFKKVCLSCC